MCLCKGMYRCPQRPEEASKPLTLELQAVVHCLMWVLETKWSPRQGQLTLLTAKPSLQPVPFDFETVPQVAQVGLEHAL